MSLNFVPFPHTCTLTKKTVLSVNFPHFSARKHTPGWRFNEVMRPATQEKAGSSTVPGPESPPLHTYMSQLDVIFSSTASLNCSPAFVQGAAHSSFPCAPAVVHLSLRTIFWVWWTLIFLLGNSQEPLMPVTVGFSGYQLHRVPIFFFLIYWLRERRGKTEEKKNINFIVPLIYTFTGWFLYVPWWGIKPVTLVYQVYQMTL